MCSVFRHWCTYTAQGSTIIELHRDAVHTDVLHRDALHTDALHTDALHSTYAGAFDIITPVQATCSAWSQPSLFIHSHCNMSTLFTKDGSKGILGYGVFACMR